MTTAKTRSRIVFSQGGKGGVGKTTVLTALVGWLRSKGFKPVLLDFDTENREKSSFASFYPEATKVNIHAPDSLSHRRSISHVRARNRYDDRSGINALPWDPIVISALLE